jgi:hypothetical protein
LGYLEGEPETLLKKFLMGLTISYVCPLFPPYSKNSLEANTELFQANTVIFI